MALSVPLPTGAQNKEVPLDHTCSLPAVRAAAP